MTTKHTVILIITIPLGLLLLSFLGMVAWYTWQIKYGTVDSQQDLITTFESNDFSSLGGTARAPRYIDDIDTYIRPYNPQVGPKDAPITIVAFIDFECPYSRRAYATFESIRERYSPVVRIVFKHFPLEAIHPNAAAAAIASQCAANQDAFWPYYQSIFEEIRLSSEAYTAYARSSGLLSSEFSRCVSEERTRTEVEQDIADGIAIGVRGTPTYVVNGYMLEGVVPEDTWNDMIITLLNQSQTE